MLFCSYVLIVSNCFFVVSYALHNKPMLFRWFLWFCCKTHAFSIAPLLFTVKALLFHWFLCFFFQVQQVLVLLTPRLCAVKPVFFRWFLFIFPSTACVFSLVPMLFCLKPCFWCWFLVCTVEQCFFFGSYVFCNQASASSLVPMLFSHLNVLFCRWFLFLLFNNTNVFSLVPMFF